MECVGCQDCSKTKRKRYRIDWDSLSWGRDSGGGEKEEKVKGEKGEWWKEERFWGGGVVILQSQWRTRKEDFCEGEVLKSHFTASGFREKDKLKKEILPHSVEKGWWRRGQLTLLEKARQDLLSEFPWEDAVDIFTPAAELTCVWIGGGERRIRSEEAPVPAQAEAFLPLSGSIIHMSVVSCVSG